MVVYVEKPLRPSSRLKFRVNRPIKRMQVFRDLSVDLLFKGVKPKGSRVVGRTKSTSFYK